MAKLIARVVERLGDQDRPPSRRMRGWTTRSVFGYFFGLWDIISITSPSGGMLAMMVIAVAFVRVLAFAPVSPSQAGITVLYRQARV